jgi:hypothetical protein
MQVMMQDKVVPTLGPEHPLVVLRKMTADNRQLTDNPFSVPLFPNDILGIVSLQTFSREDISKHFEYLSTFGPAGHPSDKPKRRPEDFKFVGLTLLYYVDYMFGAGTAHHEHSCMSNIVQVVDPNKQIAVGVALPLDVDLSPPSVRLDPFPLDCQAD